MRASLSRRLLAMTVGPISLAVGLAGLVLLGHNHRELYRSFEASTVVLARAVADPLAGPLVFEDPGAAKDMIAMLERSTTVDRAVLYDLSGRAVASYQRPGAETQAVPVVRGPALKYGPKGYLHVFEPVYHLGVEHGTLHLAASPASLSERLREGTITVLAVVLLAIVLAAFLAGLLQRSVTRPLLRLAGVMRGISGATTLSTRVDHQSDDEIGVLYGGFNRMLDQLEARQKERDRSDARLRALIAALPDPVFVVNQAGQIVETLAGRPEFVNTGMGGLRGRSIAPIIAPGRPAHVEEALSRAIKTGAPQRLAYDLDLPGGKRWFDAVLVPIASSDGAEREDRFVLFVPRDVTERQTLEVDLRQAQKMDALGRLAGGVAHDFNNILTAIQGYAALLARRLERGSPAAEEVREIEQAAERAAQLTQQLLAFSRRQVVARTRVTLSGLVAEMQRMLQRIIGEDIELSAQLTPDLPPVNADPGQIQQVVLNLVVNAREAMPRGGKLTLRTRIVTQAARRAGEPDLAPGPYVLLEVSDTGVGMDESVRARILEPFFTTKGDRGGTGLGLAMVYGIVRQTGGDVTVTSEPGKGSTFSIYLPVAAAAPAGAEATRSGVEEPARGDETILLVEDEPQLRALTSRVLRDQGYQVLAAADAQEALRVCKDHDGAIHLLVTDVVMPRMGGGELVQAARPLRPDMKVLFISGYTDSEIVYSRVARDEAPFLQKPFTPSQLGRKVREVLAG